MGFIYVLEQDAYLLRRTSRAAASRKVLLLQLISGQSFYFDVANIPTVLKKFTRPSWRSLYDVNSIKIHTTLYKYNQSSSTQYGVESRYECIGYQVNCPPFDPRSGFGF